MRRFLFFALFILTELGLGYAQAQSGGDSRSDNELKITGSPIITVFANYHTGIGARNDISGFELTRAYLGYQFNLTPTLSGKAIIDAAVPPTESFMVSQKKDIYLKNAFLTWKDKGFTISGGLVGLLQFNLQEQFWGYRYAIPSFQDLYKMGSSADLGVTAQYQFAPWISADFSFINGEGYKNVNADNKYRYGLGLTLQPIQGLTARAYTDLFQQSLTETDQKTLALFAGYKCDYFSLGAEYNKQINNAFKNGNDYSGYSVYTNIPICKKWNFFGRYDYIDSKDNNDKAWHSSTGDLVIAGVEYTPVKNLRIAPSYRYAKSLNIQTSGHNTFNTMYLSVGFNW